MFARGPTLSRGGRGKIGADISTGWLYKESHLA